MKRYLLSVLIALWIGLPAIKAQTIPNASFESWSMDTLSGMTGPVIFTHPTDWYPLTSVFSALFGGSINLYQSNVHYGSGNSSMMIETGVDSVGADAVSFFPVSSLPAKLKGYARYEGSPSDFATVSVAFFKYDAVNDTNLLIAQGFGNVTNHSSSFALFEVPIIPVTAGTPDSGLILIEYLFDNPGSRFFVDALSFDASAGIPGNKPLLSPEIFPVPMEDMLHVRWDAKLQKEYTLTLMSLTGQVVWSGADASGEVSIPVADLPKGTYMLRIANGSDIVTRKVIK